MLRGAIDFNDGWRIGGWIHSPEISVGGRLLLAFVDDQCVGSGQVDVFRQDLADAGLGDGHCGFAFPIALARVEDRARVYIKLDWSDFALLQQQGRIVDGTAATTATQGYDDDSIDWMHARGWITRPDAAFLRDLATTGAHVLPLTAPAPMEAKRLFELYRRGPVRVQEAAIRPDNLAAERAHLVDGAALPLIALHAPAGTIAVGTTRHACAPDRLLFLDTATPLSGEGDATALVYRAA